MPTLMPERLDLVALDPDGVGNARYSILRDDRMGPCGYLTLAPEAANVLVPLIQNAPALLRSLRAVVAQHYEGDGWIDAEVFAQAQALLEKVG